MKTSKKLSFTLLVVSVQLSAVAQTNPNLEQGFKPYGTYEGSPIDSVSMTNGNLVVHIPLFEYPQRGAQDVKVRLQSNGKQWWVKLDCFTNGCTARWDLISSSSFYLGQWPFMSLVVDYGRLTIGTNVVHPVPGTSVPVFTTYSADGGTHPLAPLSPGVGYRAIDASGIWYGGYWSGNTGASSVIQNRKGANDSLAGWQDANGNYITYGASDNLGRQMSTGGSPSDTTGCSGSPTGASVSGYPGPNGSTRLVKVCNITINLKTNFKKINGDWGAIKEAGLGNPFIQSVIVYNGSSWTTSPQWSFEYKDGDPNDSTINYGNITKITLPTGGTISYTYATSDMCSSSVTEWSRSVVSKTVDANDGQGPQTTLYSPQSRSTDPAGNVTVYTVQPLGGDCSFYVTGVNYYKGDPSSGGTLLKTVTTDYHYTANPLDGYGDGSSNAANVFATRVTTKWPIAGTSNFLVSKVETDPDSAFTVFANGLSVPSTLGLATERREYDYGTNSAGALLRKADYTYAALTTPSYLTANLLDLVTQKTVKNGSSTTVADTKYFYDGSSVQVSGITVQHQAPLYPQRGNLTSMQEWLNTNSSWITTKSTTFYDTGMPYQVTDLKSNLTTYSYGSAYAGAYVTQTQFPDTGSPAVHHIMSGGYDFNTGLLTSYTDQNSQTSNYSYDPLGRATSGTFPDGGSISFSFTDSVPVQILETKAVTSSLNKVSNAVFDGLGRISQTQLHDPDCTTGSGLVKVDYQYGFDSGQNTQYSKMTTPYCDTPGATYGLFKRTNTDAIGRVTNTTQTDGATSTATYDQNASTVTDEAGAQRKTQMDALGRLTAVWEAPNQSGMNYETDYAYDALNNLTSVTQKGGASSGYWRTRSFVYDSLSRMTSATNPESGTLIYSYPTVSGSSACGGDMGIVCSRTAPKPNQTGSATVTATYTYDALDRLTRKAYNDGATPTARFAYDADQSTVSGCTTAPPALTDSYPLPLRTAMCDGSGAASWAHDQMGRGLSEKRTIQVGSTAVTKTISYTYNRDGSPYKLTYPGSAKILTYTQNGSGGYSAGLPVSAVDTGSGINYVTAATYAPFGGMTSMTNGTAAGFAGMVTTDTYNIRLQPLLMSSASPTATPLSLCYNFNVGGGTSGTCAFSSGTGDNGNVFKIVNNRDTSRSQNFTYDSLNRIAAAWTDGTGSNSWGEAFTIDPWANLTQRGPYLGRTNYEGLSVSVNTANQFTGYGYDAAGNMTSDGSHSYAYDGENRLTTAAGWTYVYDGDGQRVIKCNATACTTNNTGTLYFRDMAGEVIGEAGLGGSITGEYIFFNGRRVARRDNPSSVVHYYFADHLGTHGVVTNATGTYPFEQDMDYYPYGGMQHDYSTAPVAQNYKFTGKERDSESGLDEFGARNYSSSLGRFMIPDWAATATAVPYAHFGNPQSLNLYSYVGNEPLSRNDPDGHLASPWHFGITLLAALNTGHGLVGSLTLAWQATAVDFRKGSQGRDAAHTNMHAMRGKVPSDDGSRTQSAAEARAGTAQVVSNAIKSGDTALALHAVEDQATPLHDGHEWNGFGFDAETAEHLLGDVLPSGDTVKEAYENAIKVLRNDSQSHNAPSSQAQPPSGTIGAQALADPLDEYGGAGALGAGISFSRGSPHPK